jgi:hypothetical protein
MSALPLQASGPLMSSLCLGQAGYKQENGRKVHRSSSLQRMASAEHMPKKACHARMSRPDSVVKAEVEAAGA